MLQKLPGGRQGRVQPAEPGALAEDVMLEQKPEGGQWLKGQAGWAQGLAVGRWALPGMCAPACLAEDEERGTGRPLMMRLLFPGGSRGPRVKSLLVCDFPGGVSFALSCSGI